jgi:tRNA G10  N-methylase Trm11
MSLARTNFDDVSEADLVSLVNAAVPEEPYGTSDGEKKEALKDITSSPIQPVATSLSAWTR